MKSFLLTSFLSFSLLQAYDPLIIVNKNTSQEAVETLITTDGEFETLFEMVEPDESSLLDQSESLLLPEIADEPPLFMENRENLASSEAISINEEKASPAITSIKAPLKPVIPAVKINFQQVFSGSPIIYLLLLGMSVLALFICLYSQIHLHHLSKLPNSIIPILKAKLNQNEYDEALTICLENDNLFCNMLHAGINVRKNGLSLMLETIKAQGKRSTVKFWQKLSLLNDIAIIAPMLGLLGTVLGMFYAFYDLNRSIESVSALFDGLGVSVGTTLAGLIVAILAMALQSLLRYRLVKRLTTVEHEVQVCATLISHNT